jgi:hypothetical protein
LPKVPHPDFGVILIRAHSIACDAFGLDVKPAHLLALDPPQMPYSGSTKGFGKYAHVSGGE